MLDHLKKYFRDKDDPHQKRMDRAYTRTGKLGKVNHSEALSGKRRPKCVK